MTEPAFRNVVVVGSGAAAWLTAAALHQALAPGGRTVRLVEPPRLDHGIGPAGSVEAALPSSLSFLARIGVDEGALVAAAQGCFSLGTAWAGWAGEWFQPFGTLGAPLGPVAFNQLASRLRSEGLPVNMTEASLGALAAARGRFAHPSPDPRSPLSSLAYAMHFSLDGLCGILRRAAPGVEIARARFRAAVRDEAGNVSHLLLEDGGEVAGDLFIDCSGSAALLVGDVPFERWRQWLPCDRATATMGSASASPAPFALHGAEPAGWQRDVPLRGARERTAIWSSAYPGVEGTPFENGMRSEAWRGNVVGIGSSALMLEPVARTGLHLVQTAVERLLRLFPVTDGRVEAAEYNRLTREEAERLRDFAILPYKLNRRAEEPFWDDCRAMAVPDSLSHKIAIYEARGRVALHDGETFERDDWVVMLDGLGIRPRRHDPLADGIQSEHLRRHVLRIREIFAQAAGTLPNHGDYLRRIMEPRR